MLVLYVLVLGFVVVSFLCMTCCLLWVFDWWCCTLVFVCLVCRVWGGFWWVWFVFVLVVCGLGLFGIFVSGFEFEF